MKTKHSERKASKCSISTSIEPNEMRRTKNNNSNLQTRQQAKKAS
jgi:hypothetical protein